MKGLNKKAFSGLLNLIIVLAIALFLPAWTFHYWQAWVFLSVFSVSVLVITIYLMKKDPELLERRINAGSAAEREKTQKIIQSLASIAFIALIVFPALDHRYGWSAVPVCMVMAGDVLVALGLLIVFFVFRENTFTAATIQVAAEQKVVATGPYAYVRHPMYMGALIMLAGTPPALGSWWGSLIVVPFTFVLVWRLLNEEKFLLANLAGYRQYKDKVRYRLLPFVW